MRSLLSSTSPACDLSASDREEAVVHVDRTRNDEKYATKNVKAIVNGPPSLPAVDGRRMGITCVVGEQRSARSRLSCSENEERNVRGDGTDSTCTASAGCPKLVARTFAGQRRPMRVVEEGEGQGNER